MKRLALLVIALLLLAPALTACAPDTVILYTDLKKEEVQKLIAPFVEQSGIQVEILTFGTADALMDAIAAPQDRYGQAGSAEPSATANPQPADIVLTKSMLALPELQNRDALTSYMSPSVADLPYGANGGGYWYGFGGRGWVMAWNTSHVTKKPDGFQDLADDAYPLRAVTMPNPEQYYFYPLAAYALMGESYTMSIFQTLLLNEAHFASSPTEAAGSIANGTYQVGITTYEEAKKKKDGGAPLDFVFPDQDRTSMGAYVEFYSVGLAKGGRYPKGAAKLDDWLLSPAAEKLSVELNLSDVTLRDVGSDAPVVRPLAVSPSEVIASERQASEAFNRLAQQAGR